MRNDIYLAPAKLKEPANTLARPMIVTVLFGKFAPWAAAIITNVVTRPSIPPFTTSTSLREVRFRPEAKSDRYFIAFVVAMKIMIQFLGDVGGVGGNGVRGDFSSDSTLCLGERDLLAKKRFGIVILGLPLTRLLGGLLERLLTGLLERLLGGLRLPISLGKPLTEDNALDALLGLATGDKGGLNTRGGPLSGGSCNSLSRLCNIITTNDPFSDRLHIK
jgi:hypothetical protein